MDDPSEAPCLKQRASPPRAPPSEPTDATIIKVVPLSYAHAGEVAYMLSLVTPPRGRIVCGLPDQEPNYFGASKGGLFRQRTFALSYGLAPHHSWR